MAALRGNVFINWAITMLTLADFKELTSKLMDVLEIESEFVDVTINEEFKNRQRELMYYAEVPINSYKFSIGEFQYARDYLNLNGFREFALHLFLRTNLNTLKN